MITECHPAQETVRLNSDRTLLASPSFRFPWLEAAALKAAEHAAMGTWDLQ